MKCVCGNDTFNHFSEGLTEFDYCRKCLRQYTEEVPDGPEFSLRDVQEMQQEMRSDNNEPHYCGYCGADLADQTCRCRDRLEQETKNNKTAGW